VGLGQKSHLSGRSEDSTTPAVHRATMIALLTTATTALSVSGTLGGVKVSPLANGFVSGASVPLSTLWEKRGAVIFAVRRPG
jgi:hypothetical protein